MANKGIYFRINLFYPFNNYRNVLFSTNLLLLNFS